jgi:hypothetical protein
MSIEGLVCTEVALYATPTRTAVHHTMSLWWQAASLQLHRYIRGSGR